MAFKVQTILLVASVLLIALIFQSEAFSTKSKRDAPTTADSQKTLEELLNSIKNSVDDLSNKIQDSDVVKQLSATIKNATDQALAQAQKTINDLQTKKN